MGGVVTTEGSQAFQRVSMPGNRSSHSVLRTKTFSMGKKKTTAKRPDSPEKRKGASTRAKVPAEVLDQLNRGELETANLVESLAIDFQKLLKAIRPKIKSSALARVAPEIGVSRRMALVGEVLLEDMGEGGYEFLIGHSSDTVRGWGAFLLRAAPHWKLKDRVEKIRPLADDSHFGVREWAWLAIRPHLAAELDESLTLLTPWTAEASANLRRFAVESLRPRGVWCGHIQILKDDPQRAIGLLEPLCSDPSRYVQDSVANWLNDASKTQPDWVRRLCQRWKKQSKSKDTERICTRAIRSLKD